MGGVRLVGIVALGCALTLAGAWFLWSPSPPGKQTSLRPNTAENQAEIAVLKAKLERLGNRVERVSRSAEALSREPSVAEPAAPPGPKPSLPASLHERLAIAEAERESHQAGLERLFGAERRDAAWAAEFEQVVALRLTEVLGEQGSLERVECAASVCRATLEFSSAEARAAASEAVGELDAFATETYYFPSQTGSRYRLMLYTARAGERITPALTGPDPTRDAPR